MRVKNGKCIRLLSVRTLWVQRKRNLIAAAAIVLTTLLFTALFTVVMSINATYQTYQFRQLGGYQHGTFKEVTEQQTADIRVHRLVKATGIRIVVGTTAEGVFAKTPAEISYMDENCTRWSYALPTTGRLPTSGKEITMDTKALGLLGVTPELGAKVSLSFILHDKMQTGPEITDTFTLVGWWEYDDLMPVHYMNISRDYARQMEEQGLSAGMHPFRADLNVMMASPIDIRGQMEQVDTDLGYTWEDRNADNAVRIGVNWGYTTSQLGAGLDAGTIVAIAAFLVLVFVTGYLIIYNIFQISVAGDIRYYGLLKTIGVTPRQLRCIIRLQSLMVCAVGIPVGLLLGFCVGALVMPAVIASSSLSDSALTISTSPLIFLLSALFALGTVLLSCAKPGRQAGRVSPVEASRYTEGSFGKKKRLGRRGAKVHQMAWANLGRNRSKTALVVISLALAVVLLNILVEFVGGFDLEKYLSAQSCADFIVSSPDYFRSAHGIKEYLPEELLGELKAQTEASLDGFGYLNTGASAAWMSKSAWLMDYSHYYGDEQAEQMYDNQDHRDDTAMQIITIEGLDDTLFDKLILLDGDLTPLRSADERSIAISAVLDDYGNLEHPEYYPAIGDTLTVVYGDSMWYVDSRSGEPADENTPIEYMKITARDGREVDYTVCALVAVPRSMSFRYRTVGYEAVLPVETMERDSGAQAIPLFYLFDTPDEETEAEAERVLSKMTFDPLSALMYESKASLRANFEGFQKLFLLLGGALCAIIGLVGMLNFLNAVMTSILSRRRELAVLQAVGMTNQQLKTMLIYEGMFYSLASGILALFLSFLLNPLTGRALEQAFWFFSYRFTILPVFAAIPIFVLLGWLIPALFYRSATMQSVVERLRSAEQ